MRKTLRIVNGREVWTDSNGDRCSPSRIRPTGVAVGKRNAPGGWPLHSDSAGVHPSQRQEAYDDSVKNGVATEFDPDGCAVFTSREHRRKYLKTYRLKDHDAGYGD